MGEQWMGFCATPGGLGNIMSDQSTDLARSPHNLPSLAVVIPLYTTLLDRWASLALRSAESVFSRRQIVFVGPHDVAKSPLATTLRTRGCIVLGLESHHFASRSTYNSMLLQPDFFRMFVEFDYILLFQLDAFALRDTLDYWMSLNFDFIGAPLRRSYGRTGSAGVGPGLNGGLSLRRVDSALRVLGSSRGRRIRMRDAAAMERHPRLWVIRTVRDGLIFNFSSGRRAPKVNEDLYWSYFAPRANPWFRVPNADVARGFACDAANNWPSRLEFSQTTIGIHAVHRLHPEDLKSVAGNVVFGNS